MEAQTEIVGIETKAYRYEGMLFVVHGRRLFQVDHNHFFEMPLGTELYAARMRYLKKQAPITRSETAEVLLRLKSLIEELF